MASPTQNFTRRVYHGDGAPLPVGLTLAAYGLAVATVLATALVIGSGRVETAIAEVAGFGVVPLLLIRIHRVAPAHLGLVAPRPAAIAGALVAGAGLWLVALHAATPIVVATGRRDEVAELTTHFFGGGPSALLLFVTLVAVPAVCEELTHRGLLLGGLSAGLGRALAILISTALFAILHVEPARMVATAILGVAAASCASWSRSLWPAVVLHAANNGAVALVGAGAVPAVARALDDHPGPSLAGAAALSVTGLAIVRAARVIAPVGAPGAHASSRSGTLPP